MERKLVFVGELNPYGCDPEMALYHLPRHASGNRLREHLGLTDATYAKLKKVNLCTGKWSLPEARAEALLIAAENDVVVMLGAKVRNGFGSNQPFFHIMTICPVYVCLPHPSGLNILWNDPTARDRARKILAAAAPWVPWGEQD